MESSLRERFEELEPRLKIDELNLDAEIISHPHDYWHASRGAADAISIRDKAKALVEDFESNLNISFRNENRNSKDRVTEGQLHHRVICDPDRIELHETFLEAKHQADLWVGLRESFLQKGYALKAMIELMRANNTMASSYAEQRRDAFTKRD